METDLYTLINRFEVELVMLAQRSQLPLAIISQILEKNALQAKVQAREQSETVRKKVQVEEVKKE